MKNSPWVKIGIGVLIALLSGIVGLLFHSAKKQQDFRHAWEVDEATEEAQMFKDPNEKERVLIHVERAPTDADFKENQMIQKQILQELKSAKKERKATDSIARLGVRLIYEVNEGH